MHHILRPRPFFTLWHREQKCVIEDFLHCNLQVYFKHPCILKIFTFEVKIITEYVFTLQDSCKTFSGSDMLRSGVVQVTFHLKQGQQ